MTRTTRTQLIELMARAAWEHSDESEVWDTLPQSVRDEWVHAQAAALQALEETVPSISAALTAESSTRARTKLT